MGRSYDEPFSLYGLLAESVETDDSRSFVAFTLREGARFADGSPVTVEDVLWSMETLGTQGAQRYRTAWAKVVKATAIQTHKLLAEVKVREQQRNAEGERRREAMQAAFNGDACAVTPVPDAVSRSLQKRAARAGHSAGP